MWKYVACAKLLCLLVIASACRGGLVSESESEKLPLEGTSWKLEKVDVSGSISEPPREEIYSILFDSSGIIVGRSDCNNCEGSFHRRKSDTLVLSLACTEAACRPGGSSLGHFPVYANGVFGYDIETSTLTLRKQQVGGNLSLIFNGR